MQVGSDISATTVYLPVSDVAKQFNAAARNALDKEKNVAIAKKAVKGALDNLIVSSSGLVVMLEQQPNSGSR